MGYQINSYYKSQYTGQQIENALSAFKNMAAEYSQNESYNVGDVVLYGNGLYVCTGSTTGVFDPTKWQQTTLAEIFSSLGATYSDPNSDGNVVIGVDSTVGEKILRSLTFPGLTNRYYLPFAQYIRERLQNDPSAASFSIEIPDAEEAPMHSTVIKGKTEAVNQLVQNGNFATAYGWAASSGVSFSASSNIGTCTVTGAATSNRIERSVSIPNGHTCLLRVTMILTKATKVMFTDSSKTIFTGDAVVGTQTFEQIYTTDAAITALRLYFNRSTALDTNDTAQFKNINIIDLTAEGYTSTETTDVATFKAAFLKKRGYPLPVYEAFDTGSLANVNGAYRMRGRNLWDEEWEVGHINGSGQEEAASTIRSKNYIPCEQGQTYYGYIGATATLFIVYYDAEKNFISRVGATNTTAIAPSGARYFRITTTAAYGATYKHDICINLSDASINGTYFPSHNGGSIDCSAAPLNGVGTAQDEEDFATGERTTRCKEDDFGDLNWFYASDGAYPYMAAIPSTPAKKPINNTTVANVLCGVGVSVAAAYIRTQGAYGIAIDDSGIIRFASPSMETDPAAFKTAMRGKKICYELATPVTTTETPQPVYTQYGYNVLEPVSGGVQSAEVDAVYYENIAGYIDKKLAEG